MKVDVNFIIGTDGFEIDDKYIKQCLENDEAWSIHDAVAKYFEEEVSKLTGCVDNHFPGGLHTFEIDERYNPDYSTYPYDAD